MRRFVKRKTNGFKVLTILLTALIIFSLPFIIPKLIVINNVECASQYGECPEGITSKIQNLSSKNLGNTKKTLSRELGSEFLIDDYSFQYKFPDTLKVNLLVRKAQFAFNQALIDSEGFVVGLQDNPNLPTIISSSEQKKVGDRVTNDELFALSLLQGTFIMYQTQKAEIKNDGLVVALPSNLTVIFPLRPDIERDLEYYLGALRLIITKIESEGMTAYKEIDLRFRNPVLR